VCVLTIPADFECEQPKVCEKVFIAIEAKFEASSKMCEQIVDGIDEKFKVANHRIGDLECKAENIETKVSTIDNTINSTLAKLTLLSQQNIESNKFRDEELKSHRETLIQISNTLVNISRKLEDGDTRVDNLEIKVGRRMQDSDNKFKDIEKKGTINIMDIFKYAIFMSINIGLGIAIAKIFL
jgi:predicted  nucleic acid-binding Zn-ribbon protein